MEDTRADAIYELPLLILDFLTSLFVSSNGNRVFSFFFLNNKWRIVSSQTR